MASNVQQIQGSIIAAGNSGPLTIANSQMALYVGPGLTGTVQVSGRPSGGTSTYEPLTPTGQTTPNITAPGMYAFPFVAGDWDFCVSCTVFTSGTAPFQLQAAMRD
jgi:hypothetical protein